MHNEEHQFDKSDEVKPKRRISSTFNTANITNSEDPIIESNEEVLQSDKDTADAAFEHEKNKK